MLVSAAIPPLPLGALDSDSGLGFDTSQLLPAFLGPPGLLFTAFNKKKDEHDDAPKQSNAWGQGYAWNQPAGRGQGQGQTQPKQPQPPVQPAQQNIVLPVTPSVNPATLTAVAGVAVVVIVGSVALWMWSNLKKKAAAP